jgi:hypothetical protein
MNSHGEADFSVIGRLLAEPARSRALIALSDGRWLSASMLALQVDLEELPAACRSGQRIDEGGGRTSRN